MQRKIYEGDFIKGVAIFGVILIHVTAFSLRTTQPLTEGGLLFAMNQMGRFSVPVFFMLSGLFLFYRYFGEEAFPTGTFYKRRLLYILVPYLLWSLFYLIYGRLAHPDSVPRSLKETLGALFTGEVYYHLYYIVVMVQFYLLLPLLIRAFRRFGGLTVVSFAFLVSLAANSTTWWEVHSRLPWMIPYSENVMRLFPVWLFYFCLGGWFGLNIKTVREWLGKIPLAAILLFFGSTGLFMLLDAFLRKEMGFFQISVLAYSVASLLLWFRLAEKWRGSWVSLLGRHSFGLYLIHPLILNLLSKITPVFLTPASWAEFAFMLVGVMGLSLGVAALIRRLPYSFLFTGK
jgi:surface polysaccharide O-acyltransferase-like enzyme